MRVVLTRPSLIMHGAGELVEVSPDRANYLLSVGSATLVEEKKEEKPKTTRGTKKK